MMKIIAGLLVLGLFSGCASVPSENKKELPSTESLVSEKESRIRELEALLAQRQVQIQEKDSQIQQLKDKLRSLGVF